MSTDTRNDTSHDGARDRGSDEAGGLDRALEVDAPAATEEPALGVANRAERRFIFRARRRSQRDDQSRPASSDPEADEDVAERAREQTPDAWAGFEVYQPQGAVLRDRKRQARRGGYAPRAAGAPTTTRQGEILNTAILAAPTDAEGITVGVDKLTKSMVAHDPFTGYRKKQISSPGVIVLGILGSGKSSLVKTVYVLRPLTFRKRRVVLADRKPLDGRGEYTDVTLAMGGNWFPMRLGSDADGCRISPMDPVILKVIGAQRQRILLRGMIERLGEGRALDEWERKALRVAHQLVLAGAEQEGRVPVLEDLVPRLGSMDHGGYADLSKKAQERVHQAGIGVRFRVEEMLEELDGLFNGETSQRVNLGAKLTSFDISQLPEDGPAAALVMSVAQAWVLGQIRTDPGWATTFVVEEGWDMLSGPIGRTSKAMQLLARGLGLSMVCAMQHIRQVRQDSEAREMLQEPQTIHLYRQEREEDVQDCIRNFGLHPESAETLRTQPPGSHLLKIGSRPEIAVRHLRSAWETAITDTDNAMESWAR